MHTRARTHAHTPFLPIPIYLWIQEAVSAKTHPPKLQEAHYNGIGIIYIF